MSIIFKKGYFPQADLDRNFAQSLVQIFKIPIKFK